jgi:hypothetical protein
MIKTPEQWALEAEQAYWGSSWCASDEHLTMRPVIAAAMAQARAEALEEAARDLERWLITGGFNIQAGASRIRVLAAKPHDDGGDQ